MKLHYQLKARHDRHLSDAIIQYPDVIPEILCKELIEFFEESITFRIDDHRKQSTEMQLMGDPRPEALAYRQLLTHIIYPLGEKYERKDGKINFNGEWLPEGSKDFPWEQH